MGSEYPAKTPRTLVRATLPNRERGSDVLSFVNEGLKIHIVYGRYTISKTGFAPGRLPCCVELTCHSRTGVSAQGRLTGFSVRALWVSAWRLLPPLCAVSSSVDHPEIHL